MIVAINMAASMPLGRFMRGQPFRLLYEGHRLDNEAAMDLRHPRGGLELSHGYTYVHSAGVFAHGSNLAPWTTDDLPRRFIGDPARPVDHEECCAYYIPEQQTAP
jgi:hypothetical protein